MHRVKVVLVTSEQMLDIVGGKLQIYIPGIVQKGLKVLDSDRDPKTDMFRIYMEHPSFPMVEKGQEAEAFPFIGTPDEVVQRAKELLWEGSEDLKKLKKEKPRMKVKTLADMRKKFK